jgi:sugar lactone lactonase YvrE
MGNFLVGTMAYDEAPGRAALYRIEPDRSVAIAVEPVNMSNGLAWTEEGDRAYYVDSLTRRIDLYQWSADNGLHRRAPLVSIEPEAGLPDGIAVDRDGGVWVALYGGGQVRRYDAEGTLSEVVELPVPKTTACTFGGPELATLFITTSRHQEPLADSQQGALFAVEVGVRGVDTRPFAG